MTTPLPIEALVQTAEEDEAIIEACIARGDALSVDTALSVANQAINKLIGNITKRIYAPEEKRVIAEHLVALGIVAIGRTEDILDTLTHTDREVDLEDLVAGLCELRLAFAAFGYDEAGWMEHLDDEFPPEA